MHTVRVREGGARRPRGATARPVTAYSDRPARLRASGLAGESDGAYGASKDGEQRRAEVGRRARPVDVEGSLARLAGAVDAITSVSFDDLADDAVRELLARMNPSLRKLQAMRTQAAGELERRAVATARTGREEQAKQDNRRRLRDQLGLTPMEAKAATQTGSRLKDAPGTRRAHGAGTLSDAHARVITDTLEFVPRDQREEVEQQLLRLARSQDAVTLGRSARRLLAKVDQRAAERQEVRQHRRRSVRVSDAEDGSVRGGIVLYGLQAEKFRTALHAFASPDLQGEVARTSEQRYADALENLLDAALRSGSAPSQHGVRPHVVVVVDYSALALGAGIAELGFTGPITMATLRPLLSDCTVSRIIMGPDSIPIEAGASVRTVPVALWKYLLVRDGGCTWQGCDAPAAWCDVAHGSVPFRDDGRLAPENAALLCRRHHRRFDNGPWRMLIRGPSVTYERADR